MSKLVIIAAGEGSRIRSVSKAIPKTLLEIGGKQILDHLLDNCLQVGITQCVIVTGYRAQDITDFLKTRDRGLELETVQNPDWKSPNGISVLKAKSHIPKGDDFLISMSDHLYGPALLDLVLQSSLAERVANVGLDFNPDQIFDLDDGMKVSVDPSDREIVTGMSKELASYQAIDCGLFRCRYEFFDALEEARERGKCSLSDACNQLIPERRLGGVDIGNRFWIDVDTPEAFAYAERVYSTEL
ncbi:sugar phosphate nucleotidyltransferase [Candidatus Neomarinimicrobiota bacterium]